MLKTPAKLGANSIYCRFAHHQLVPQFGTTTTKRRKTRVLSVRSDNSQTDTSLQQQQQQLNLSVLRFTFGIPGLDESYLPRWIGYGFGSLIILNHLLGSNVPITSAQLVCEALGLSLAVFSISLPYLGKFLKGGGAMPVDQATVPIGAEQIFAMSQNVPDVVKEDLAWATYVLLRNTNSVSVLIQVGEVVCVRGYWRIPDGLSRDDIPNWFRIQIEKLGLSGLKEELYFPRSADSGLKELLPKGTNGSVLVQQVVGALSPATVVEPDDNSTQGLVLLASTIDYAYTDKDKSWIKAVSNKFSDKMQ